MNILSWLRSPKAPYAVLLTALLMRLFFFFEFYYRDLDITPQRNYDTYIYHNLADTIIKSDLLLRGRYLDWTNVISGVGENRFRELYSKNDFEVSPGYPYLIALVYAAFGNNPYHFLYLQVLLGVLLCLLVFLIADRLLGRETAVIAAFIVAVFDTLIFYTCFLLRESLTTFIVVLLVYLLLKAGSGTGKKTGIICWLLSGIAFGAAWALNFSCLFLAPFVIFAVFYGAGALKQKIINTLLIVAGITIILSPFIARNIIVKAKPLSLGASSYAYDIPVFNGPKSSPVSFNLAGQIDVIKEVYAKSSGKTPDLYLKTIRAHKNIWGYLRLELRKFAAFWNSYEVMDQVRYLYYKKAMLFFLIPHLSYGLIAPFAILGLILLFKRWKDLNLLYAGVILALFTALNTVVLSRSRQAAYPFLAVFASYGICWIAGIIEKKDYKKLIPPAALILALFVCLQGSFIKKYFPSDSSESMGLYFSSAYIEIGKARPAEYLTKRLGLPKLAKAFAKYHKGTEYFRQRRFDEAILNFEYAIELNPRFVAAYNNLGIVYYYMGDLDRAVEQFRKALDIDPENPDTRRYLLSVKPDYKF